MNEGPAVRRGLRPINAWFSGDAPRIKPSAESTDRQSPPPEAEVRALHLEEVITLELEKMSEKNRVAYVLSREEELSVQEAADVLGTTPAVIKQRAHRAYEHLRVATGAAGWRPQSGASGGQLRRQVEHALCEP